MREKCLSQGHSHTTATRAGIEPRPFCGQRGLNYETGLSRPFQVIAYDIPVNLFNFFWIIPYKKIKNPLHDQEKPYIPF